MSKDHKCEFTARQTGKTLNPTTGRIKYEFTFYHNGQPYELGKTKRPKFDQNGAPLLGPKNEMLWEDVSVIKKVTLEFDAGTSPQTIRHIIQKQLFNLKQANECKPQDINKAPDIDEVTL